MKDKELWLFDLAHGNLTVDGIAKGFLEHYALKNKTMEHVQQDLHFRTFYGEHYMGKAMGSLRLALEAYAKSDR